MKKFFSNLFIIIYAIFAIFITICLLSYNEYKVTEFGNYSFIIIDSNDIKGDFQKGSLVIVDKDEEPEVGEKAFFYNSARQNEITLAEVKIKEATTDTETTYTFEGDKMISDDYMIGSTAHATELPKVGTVLGIVESKWGYLFLVVLPSLIAFLYEITKAVEDFKNSKEVEEQPKKKKVAKNPNTDTKKSVKAKDEDNETKEKTKVVKVEKIEEENEDIE